MLWIFYPGMAKIDPANWNFWTNPLLFFLLYRFGKLIFPDGMKIENRGIVKRN